MDQEEYFSLYVTGIPNDMTADGLKNLFSNCGNVVKSFFLAQKNPDLRRSGIVKFIKVRDGYKALEMFKEFKLGNTVIKSTIAKRKEKPTKDNHVVITDKEDLTDLVEISIAKIIERAKKSSQDSKQKYIASALKYIETIN